jgi:hypothetical protein
MGRFVQNKVDLAKAVEVSRLTLDRYFAMPGHPERRSDGRHDVPAWRAFVAAHKVSPQAGPGGNGTTYALSEREKALIEKNKIEAARSKLKLQIETGEFLPKSDVCRDVEVVCSCVRRELTKILCHEAPPRLEMLRANELRRPMRKICEELTDQLFYRLSAYADEFQAVTGNGSG